MRVLGSIVAVFLSCVTAQAQDAEQSALLMHWWISDAEADALNVVVEAASAQGVTVDLLPIKSHGELREVLSDLLRIGRQPEFTQWIASGDMGALMNSTDLVLTWPELSDRVVPELRELLTVNGSMGAIPIVTHIQNAMFVNTALLEAHALSVPQDWAQLLSVAEHLQAQNVQPVITSSEPWQLRMLFNDILLGLGGIEFYNAFYEIELSEELSAVLRETYDVLFRIRAMQAPDQPDYWADIAQGFGRGDAAFLFLGDFAWAELVRTPGMNVGDFDCVAVPGTQDVLVYGTDIFIGFSSENVTVRDAQRKLGEIILDPQVQRDFVAIKGGVPVVQGLSVEGLAPCARTAYGKWGQEGTELISTPWAFNRIALNFLEKSLSTVWSDPNVTAQEATDTLLSNLEAVSLPGLEQAD